MKCYLCDSELNLFQNGVFSCPIKSDIDSLCSHFRILPNGNLSFMSSDLNALINKVFGYIKIYADDTIAKEIAFIPFLPELDFSNIPLFKQFIQTYLNFS